MKKPSRSRRREFRDGPLAIVVMGVCGCGKSTFGQAIGERLGAEFIEGDALHPRANIDKMSRGEALDDRDRKPWLETIVAVGADHLAQGRPVVISCSALKRGYRDRLRHMGEALRFAHLVGDRDTILQRMRRRVGHFMPASLLDSQLETLESTELESDVLELNLDASIDENLQKFLHYIQTINSE